MRYLIILTILLTACNNNRNGGDEIRDGGGCTYKDKAYPARLIALIPQYDENFYDAELEVEIWNRIDTVRFHETTRRYLSGEEIRRDKIEIGNTYKYIESNIVTGTCSPHLFNIELTRY